MIEGLIKYSIIIFGGLLVGLSYNHVFPTEWGAACLIVGIISLVHGITWDLY